MTDQTNTTPKQEKILITDWQEILTYIAVHLRTQTCVLFYRSLFSIAARNRWKVYYIKPNHILMIEDDDNGTSTIVASTNYLMPTDAYKPHGRVGKIHLTDIHFTKTNYKIKLHTKHYNDHIVRTLDGAYSTAQGTLDARYFRRNGLESTIEFGSYDKCYNSAVSNKEYFRDLIWEEAHSYALSLCIKDIFPFKRGMIVDRASTIYYKYHERNPLHWKDEKYFIAFSMACDLNKTTLEALEAVETNIMHCSKQQFGCQNGCTHSCRAEELKTGRTWVKTTLIKLYQEVFNG